MSKAKDLLETVKYMMIENGLDAVPQSLLKSAIDEAIAELEAQEAKSCEWHYKEFDNSWNGTCGVKWWLEEIPSVCEMNFCPKCGGKLIEKES